MTTRQLIALFMAVANRHSRVGISYGVISPKRGQFVFRIERWLPDRTLLRQDRIIRVAPLKAANFPERLVEAIFVRMVADLDRDEAHLDQDEGALA